MCLSGVEQVCVGVGASTVTDRQVGMSLFGLLVGAAAVGATALYQVTYPSAVVGISVGKALAESSTMWYQRF